MFKVMMAGGLMMWPLLFCSIVAMGIILERAFALQARRLLPEGLLTKALALCTAVPPKGAVASLTTQGPLGKIFAVGLSDMHSPLDVIEQRMEAAGRYAVHGLEKYLPMLGTIAMVTPLLGLLGTVLGMIEVFSHLMQVGLGDPQALAGGIFKALFTTAAGLAVAIPATVAHRFFQSRIETLAIEFEQQAGTLLQGIARVKQTQWHEDTLTSTTVAMRG